MGNAYFQILNQNLLDMVRKSVLGLSLKVAVKKTKSYF